MATVDLIHTWTNQIKVPGLPTLPADPPLLITGDVDMPIAKDVLAGQTAEIDGLSIDKTKIVSLLLNCTGAITLYTNAADGTGGQVIPLAAKKSLVWNNTQTFSNPITV